MQNPYKVFHSACDLFRSQINFLLVRPEDGRNVGSAARAIQNMDLRGAFRIVGSPNIINDEARRLAKHAAPLLSSIQYFSSLGDALAGFPNQRNLNLATTARVGSAHRAHPIWIRSAIQRAITKLVSHEVDEINIVLGPEGSGLTNEEVGLCDWVVTIPSSLDYRSVNLAQSVLIAGYEANVALLEEWKDLKSVRPSQKERLVAHIVKMAEEVGFVLPGDPFKMKPRLEEILSHLPNHLKDVKTLHGLIDQVVRSVRKGQKDMKGRFKRLGENLDLPKEI